MPLQFQALSSQELKDLDCLSVSGDGLKKELVKKSLCKVSCTNSTFGFLIMPTLHSMLHKFTFSFR